MLPPPENAGEAGAMHAMWMHLGERDAEAFREKAPQWFGQGIPGHESIDISVASLLSRLISSKNSTEVSEERLSRIRNLIEPTES